MPITTLKQTNVYNSLVEVNTESKSEFFNIVMMVHKSLFNAGIKVKRKHIKNNYNYNNLLMET